MSTRNRREVPLEGNAPDFAADATAFGEFLRTRRQNAGISLDQITNETKIPQRHFDALEHGSVRSWPRGMYTRAMLRAYAESVGLDKEYLASQFERAFTAEDAPPAPAPVATMAPIAPAPRRRQLQLPAWRVQMRVGQREALAAAGLAMAVALIAFIATFALRTDRPSVAVVDQTSGPVRSSDIALAGDVTPAPVAVHATPRVERTSAALTERAGVAPRAVDGELIITSQPPGARVMVDGVGRGSTPARIKYLSFGSKRVRVTMDGYVGAERSVNLTSTAPTANVQLTLTPRQ